MMKTEYFTIADGPEFGLMGAELSRRVKALNGVDVRIVTDDICLKYGIGAKRQYWMKAFLWEEAQPDTERIIYLDGDILPVAPFPDYVLKQVMPFSARLDVPAIGAGQKRQHPLFNGIRHYFNNGFFVATRASQWAFDKLKAEVNNPVHATCIEQTWHNKHIDETVGLNILPREIAYIVDYEPEPEGVILRHYCAGNKLARFQADMAKYPI